MAAEPAAERMPPEMLESNVAAVVELIIRIGVGAFFLASAAAKVVGGSVAVANAIARYRLLPARLVRAAAHVLPATEVSVGFGVLLELTALPAVAIGIVFLVGASLAAVRNLARGRRFPCGCFGDFGDRRIGWGLVTENSLITAALGFLVVRFRDVAPVSIWEGLAAAERDAVPILLMAGTSAFLLFAWGQIEGLIGSFETYRSESYEDLQKPLNIREKREVAQA